ncbi:type II secretion system protein GspE [Virgibacillus phasianinus]|uniref:Type II secretion system protein GspE n=1 Tax=Virgibacillus phasianinus TaxID=2017483 RepID=A0A220U5G7_9BACI|nr:GspE/PulE family protein [Virgibacillus phasianinus]ASK62963.1 type II secretion system protein GspE [Virgibacillus phasianinus]
MVTRRRLGDLLHDAGLVTTGQINETLEKKKVDQKLGDALLERGLITERQLIEVLEFQLGIPFVSLYQYPIEQHVLGYVPKELAQRNFIMPLKMQDGALLLAMKDPMDYYIIDDLEIATGFRVSPVIAAKDDILFAINKYYFKKDPEMTLEPNAANDEAPVIRLLDQLLYTAIQLKASDIHIDPQERKVIVRYRIDGRLKTENIISKQMQNPLIARIKILANLNITETRLPQDGQIKTNVGLSPVDLRISCLPTVFGEKIVVRILDLNNTLMQLSELNFSERNLKKYKKLITQPAGLVLLTGPTGSGKTSTLYASINQLNQENVNIITVEDPVEYQLEGINQVQVNSTIGLTFAHGLRSILRQDPNIIMVGEIRDQETAEAAIRASLTGHLVFSTLHTNSAVDTIPRLIDMGIEPYLVVSSISGIVAQRLVRKICRDCITKREPTVMEKEIFADNGVQPGSLYFGKGCSSCHQQGYRGRLAVQELLVVDETIKCMLLQNKSMAEIRAYAKKQGISFLIQDGLEKMKHGLTTMEEIMQVSINI